MTRHHYGISRVVSQMSFCRETVGGIAKCRLFSKAAKCIVYRDVSKHSRGLCVFVYVLFGDVQIYLKCLYTVFTNGGHGGKKLVPSHESEALEDKQKLQMKTFSELAEC